MELELEVPKIQNDERKKERKSNARNTCLIAVKSKKLWVCSQDILNHQQECKDNTTTSYYGAVITDIKPHNINTYQACVDNSMYFPGYFQVKAMKFQVNLAQNHSVSVNNVDMKKMYMYQ